jgi:tetratricopeptide (TPR) repeat protein
MSLTREEIAQLSNRALELIGEEAFEDARQLGQQMVQAKEEAGYRILAMIHVAQEEPAEALALIEQGVTEMPQSWQMRLLLGNLLSESGDLEQAMQAFEAAKTLPDAELHWIQINQAVVHGRRNEIDQALNLLQGIDHPEAINEAFDVQLGLLDSVGRHDLIVELAEEDLDLLQSPETEEEAATLSSILSHIAAAYWYEERDGDEVEHYLRQAIAFDRSNPDALYLLREQDPIFSDQSQVFSLMVKGTLLDQSDSAPAQQVEFITSYEVIADTPEEALDLVRRFEVPEIDPDSLQIEAIEPRPNDEEEPKGVYQVGELLVPGLETE